MSIKNYDQYKYFISWLNHRLNMGTLNRGQYKLMSISESLFIDYCSRYNDDPKFRSSQDLIYKVVNRELKIEDIFNETNSKI